jgi:hypothetical protein
VLFLAPDVEGLVRLDTADFNAPRILRTGIIALGIKVVQISKWSLVKHTDFILIGPSETGANGRIVVGLAAPTKFAIVSARVIPRGRVAKGCNLEHFCAGCDANFTMTSVAPTAASAFAAVPVFVFVNGRSSG